MTTNMPLALFISSDMQELTKERYRVRAALSDYRIYGWLWENDAGARSTATRITFLKEVEACDIYIGLFWLRYGRHTIEEYEHARKHNKPCLIYEKYIDVDQRDQRLIHFLEKAGDANNPEGSTIRRFTTAKELAEFVQEDVMRLLTNIFRESRQRPEAQYSRLLDMASELQTKGQTLSIIEQVELTEKLLKCSAVSDKPQREAVLSLLPTEITQRIARGSTNITDVLQIVRKCLEHKDGIERLIWAVHFVGGNTLPLLEATTFLKRINNFN